jgi:uncharacterized protein (TIGR00251 family)
MSDATVLAVQVTPRARKNEVAGWRAVPGGALELRVRLTAPPVEGAANAALVAFLAETLGVRKSQVELVAGHSARHKRVRVTGLARAEVEARLGG